MIRALFLLLIFASGLAAAVAFQGKMHHLRLAVPDRLPGWTSMVNADAGVRQGRMDLPAKGRWPATRLDWTARLPAQAGWVWDITLTGEGVVLAGQVTLTYRADKAMLSGVTGSVDLGAMPDVPVPVQGIVRIDAMVGEAIDLTGKPKVIGTLKGSLAALALDGANFGNGPLTITLDDTGAWRGELALKGGVSPLDAILTGTIIDPLAQLQAIFADGPSLPPIMRAMLAAAGQPEGQGWQLSLPVPVP